VNTCINEQGRTTGVRSTLIKVNKKEKFAVEFEFAGYDCKVPHALIFGPLTYYLVTSPQGVPLKTLNLFEGLQNWTWGGCVLDTTSGDAVYYHIDYLSTYPTPNPGNIISRAFLDAMCSSDNMNYIEFTVAPLTSQFNLASCDVSEMNSGYYEMYSADSCASTGQLTYSLYDDDMCTNQISIMTFDECYSSTDDDDYDPLASLMLYNYDPSIDGGDTDYDTDGNVDSVDNDSSSSRASDDDDDYYSDDDLRRITIRNHCT
jgi:hypothetical protein